MCTVCSTASEISLALLTRFHPHARTCVLCVFVHATYVLVFACELQNDVCGVMCCCRLERSRNRIRNVGECTQRLLQVAPHHLSEEGARPQGNIFCLVSFVYSP